jgi:hypothetical protein
MKPVVVRSVSVGYAPSAVDWTEVKLDLIGLAADLSVVLQPIAEYKEGVELLNRGTHAIDAIMAYGDALADPSSINWFKLTLSGAKIIPEVGGLASGTDLLYELANGLTFTPVTYVIYK